MSQSYEIHHLPPPGPSVYSARQLLFKQPTDTTSIPPLFLSALKIREEVFIHEQRCTPSLEIDADDPVSHHWVILASPSSTSPSPQSQIPAATIRLMPPFPNQIDAHNGPLTDSQVIAANEPDYRGSKTWDGKESFVQIGRLSTVKEFRGRGYGRVLVEEAVRWVAENGREWVGRGSSGDGEWKGLIGAHAQTVVKSWYEKLGFVVDEGIDVWWEEGIEHVGIWKKVDVTE